LPPGTLAAGNDNRVKVPSFIDQGNLASGLRFDNEL
jgi:hypothetical protein